MAYRFMKQNQEQYSITKMAKVFGVSRSGYISNIKKDTEVRGYGLNCETDMGYVLAESG